MLRIGCAVGLPDRPLTQGVLLVVSGGRAAAEAT